MKKGKRPNRAKRGSAGAAVANRGKAGKPAADVRRPVRKTQWPVIAGFAVAFFILYEMYGPAINGPFLFDDKYLPFTRPNFQRLPLTAWLAGVRPTLMFTFWVNYQLSADNPYSYHLINIVLHFLNGALVFLIVRRLLERVQIERWRRETLAAFSGAVFLFHPMQTEAVAYVASRSENLSVFFFYAAFAFFLYRHREPIGIGAAAAILLLFGAAVTSKEHTAVLPVLLLLTDYFFNPGFSLAGIKRNWRLYAGMGVAGAAGLAFVLKTLAASDTAGFRVEGLPWYNYFATQCKVIWIYLRMFVLPVGQNVDHDYPMVSSPLDPVALMGFAALAVAVILAWLRRRERPLVVYGFYVYLLLAAPTSSFVPIKDALVERRLYLPMIGLLIVTAGLLRRWKVPPKTLGAAVGAVLVVITFLGFQRARVWGGTIPLWEDSVAKTPKNWRANFQLAYAYFEHQRCSDAVRQYARAAKLRPPDYRLLVDWALAYDCANQPEEALAKLQEAARLESTAHVYSLIGMMQAKLGRHRQALAALQKAAEINPRFAVTYFYRGNVYTTLGEYEQAAREYRRALELRPDLDAARRALARVERSLAGGG